MGLKNWIEELKASRLAGSALMKASPKLMEAFQHLGAAQNGAGAIDRKTRELIALAVAVTTRCETCIAGHVKAAVAAGVTRAELADAMGTAIAMNAGAAYAYSVRAFDAYEQFSEEAKAKAALQ
ncbi:carboxymuconolactone decarboxylase family protein [Ramlibacter sp. WS9]|uniref:carboxymuconolactone decarboxylase family protein n=1 Tax=Ramlibacter sp. WS9 TaxID=1882741 RepID=UPI0011419109|nr:carboxymuconolactone decarboxylase family protein [Ramlibacter sp. WS9]ROZ78024.1 carboxymuconolactone decarboxylase family protein [Ramlibacter sp. WS9]